jgi:hypothetical protein
MKYLLLLLTLSSTLTVQARNIEFSGYITEVLSPTTYKVEEQKIVLQDRTVKKGDGPMLVGTKIEVRGVRGEQGEVLAETITVDNKESVVSQQAIISKEISATDQKEFLLHADGRKIRINSGTKLILGAGISSIKDVLPGHIVKYEGVMQMGEVLAKSVEFLSNDLEQGESRLRNSIKVDGDIRELRSEDLKEVELEGKEYKVIQSVEVQRYITRVGESLVPSYQKSLKDGDPQKIRFIFVVVRNRKFNAVAYASGLVVVNSGVFDVLENEAQLAALVGHEIAHATQEHAWRLKRANKKKRDALKVGTVAATALGLPAASLVLHLMESAVKNSYARTLENQADRIGLEYMVDAGYDPREAPALWRLVEQKRKGGGGSLFSSHDSLILRRSYLMSEIKNNYASYNHGEMIKERSEFRRIAQTVKELSAK